MYMYMHRQQLAVSPRDHSKTSHPVPRKPEIPDATGQTNRPTTTSSVHIKTVFTVMITKIHNIIITQHVGL